MAVVAACFLPEVFRKGLFARPLWSSKREEGCFSLMFGEDAAPLRLLCDLFHVAVFILLLFRIRVNHRKTVVRRPSAVRKPMICLMKVALGGAVLDAFESPWWLAGGSLCCGVYEGSFVSMLAKYI